MCCAACAFFPCSFVQRFSKEASTTTNVTIADISATQALIVYKDSGNSSYGTAQVLDIAISTVTGNTEYVFNRFTPTLFKLARLSSSLFVTVYTASILAKNKIL